jgi:hypothetical protein
MTLGWSNLADSNEYASTRYKSVRKRKACVYHLRPCYTHKIRYITICCVLCNSVGSYAYGDIEITEMDYATGS